MICARTLGALAVAAMATLSGIPSHAAVMFPFTVDFSTEDDGVTPLVNGQAIDDEFGNLFTITSDDATMDHNGPAIFDTDPAGPNAGGADEDLLVGLGNALILQNSELPQQTVPGIFDTPDDEQNKSDLGQVEFNFLNPTELLATIYHSFGIHPETIVYNHLNQPRELVKAEALTALLS